jgi:hypothetical protein
MEEMSWARPKRHIGAALFLDGKSCGGDTSENEEIELAELSEALTVACAWASG